MIIENNFENQNLLVKNGTGVLIKSGAKVT